MYITLVFTKVPMWVLSSCVPENPSVHTCTCTCMYVCVHFCPISSSHSPSLPSIPTPHTHIPLPPHVTAHKQSPQVPSHPVPPSSTAPSTSMTASSNSNPRSATPQFRSPPAPQMGPATGGDQVNQVTIQPNPAAVAGVGVSGMQRGGAGSPATPQQAYHGQHPGMQPQV